MFSEPPSRLDSRPTVYETVLYHELSGLLQRDVTRRRRQTDAQPTKICSYRKRLTVFALASVAQGYARLAVAFRRDLLSSAGFLRGACFAGTSRMRSTERAHRIESGVGFLAASAWAAASGCDSESSSRARAEPITVDGEDSGFVTCSGY